jgi:tetratricopeptide (TPR) repeat protein
MTAEALSLDAQLARDTVGRWIRGRTVPTLAALRAVEEVLSDRLGYPVDLAAAVKNRRSAQQRNRKPDVANAGGSAVVEPSLGKSLARLLDPRLEIVAFLGRQVELADLVAWCLDGHGGQLRLVTGPGGVGKTRLSVELAQRMTARGWRCERIAYDQEDRAIPTLRSGTPKPLLLVVDYAETRPRLRQMFATLASDEGKDVRVLLLARSAGEWWDELAVEQPAVWDLAQQAKAAELKLSSIVAADVPDAEVVARAVESFASELGVPERAVEITGSGTARRRVLDLHAAALVALLDGPGTEPVHIDINVVLQELLRHEMHFWYDSAHSSGISDGPGGWSSAMLRQLVAAGCLLGAATREEALLLTSRISGGTASVKVTEWLRNLYPPEADEAEWLGSLQPDRLAELHTVRELANSPELAQACLRNMDARQTRRALTLLARASSDDKHAEVLLTQTLPDVAGLIENLDASRETLTAIYNAIPYPSVTLAQAALVLAQKIAALPPAESDPAQRAIWLSNLGLWLSALGRYDEALVRTKEAVATCREQAAVDPDRYRSILANSLIHLGTTLLELHRDSEALAVTEEAVATYRELAAVDPDRYRPQLAQSLNNLGIQLSRLGRAEEALPIAEESLSIRRAQPIVDNDYHRVVIAQSLNNLGALLQKLGRPREAQPIIEEALAIRRELAVIDPDRYRTFLVISLNNLSRLLLALNRPEEALPIIEEAVANYRELAAINPDHYNSQLAGSLADLANAFARLERTAESEAAHLESRKLRPSISIMVVGRI